MISRKAIKHDMACAASTLCKHLHEVLKIIHLIRPFLTTSTDLFEKTIIKQKNMLTVHSW